MINFIDVSFIHVKSGLVWTYTLTVILSHKQVSTDIISTNTCANGRFVHVVGSIELHKQNMRDKYHSRV